MFALKYHFVWCPKYRRPVLEGPVADRLREIIGSVAQELGLTVLALEVMPDPVHAFVEGDPQVRHVSEGTVRRYIAAQKGV